MKFHRAGDRRLQLFVLNEEFLVNVSHHLALITSLPFVHTARRSDWLSGPVSCSEWVILLFILSNWNEWIICKVQQTLPLRRSRSRNKVSVGEPADGSLTHPILFERIDENLSFIYNFMWKNRKITYIFFNNKKWIYFKNLIK